MVVLGEFKWKWCDKMCVTGKKEASVEELMFNLKNPNHIFGIYYDSLIEFNRNRYQYSLIAIQVFSTFSVSLSQ